MKEEIVGHICLSLSKPMFKILQLSQSKLCCTVTGKWVNRGASFGLKIPVKYTLYINEKALSWIQEKTIKETDHMNNIKKKCLKWNLVFHSSSANQRETTGEMSILCKNFRVSANWVSTFWRLSRRFEDAKILVHLSDVSPKRCYQ